MLKIISCFLSRSFLLMLLMSCVLSYYGHSQSDASLKKDGDRYFEAGDFRSALRMYKQVGLENTQNKDALLNLGIAMYETNDLDGAIKVFQSLINEGKTEAPVFFYTAKSYQAKNLYQDAITFYKKFLQRAEDDDPLRTWVKDELSRCANGSRLKYADQEAYVENAGAGINTQYAEYGVKNSPTIIDKIYFNSNRNSETIGRSAGNNFDILSAALVNGQWTPPSSLPTSINTPAYEEVSGFSNDGQILYYLTILKNGARMRTDTFSGEEGGVYQGTFSAPFPQGRGTDISFFNDSICMFSSNSHGGFGGYDLYISVLSNGSWSAPVNLGPSINTFYNERYPFLTRDGETIFYSSDNLQSVGGLDIFKSVFDPEKLAWSFPQNLGFPINSSLDDSHLELSPDGMTAFISSNRKEGHGDFDLYRVFFKQPVQAHQEISFLPTFYQTMQSKGSMEVGTPVTERPVQVKEYFISHIFIDENGEVLSPQNTKKLDLLANLLLIYPRIKAELSSFELPSGQRTFNLYFSIKKAEKAAEYLQSKGVPSQRIILKGYGSSFPLANNPAGISNSPVVNKLNHRIEITLHDYEDEPVITHLENIPVSDNLLDPRGAKFIAMRHGMYYSVQIASITQILQNSELESVEEMFIDVDNAQGNYRYMVGLLPTYKDAEMKLKQMHEFGFPDAYIVPYLDGIRLVRDEIPGIASDYPDLLNYLAKTKN